MPGEPPRVQPSKKVAAHWDDAGNRGARLHRRPRWRRSLEAGGRHTPVTALS